MKKLITNNMGHIESKLVKQLKFKNKIKFIKFLNEYKSFNKNPNCETVSIKKNISSVHKVDLFSLKYNYATRYIEYDTNFITRWTKSFFRESFALNDAKKVHLPLIYSKLTYLYNSFDYVLCLSENPRISVEMTHGNLKKFSDKEINLKFKKKKIVTNIKNSIIFSNISSYNPWHYFVEILSLAYDLSNKSISKNKKIYIPENELFTEIISLLGKKDKIFTYKTNSPIIAKNCFFYQGFQGEMLATTALSNIINKIKKHKTVKNKFYNHKNVYIGRGDTDSHRNRRKLINELEVINEIKKYFPNLKVIRPGFLTIKETILLMHNAKNIFSTTGTQLALNSLFANKPLNIIELTPINYYGLTTGELVTVFKKAKYLKGDTKSKKLGFMLYEDQVANITNLKKIMKYFEKKLHSK